MSYSNKGIIITGGKVNAENIVSGDKVRIGNYSEAIEDDCFLGNKNLPRVFISYRRGDDVDICDRIYDSLLRRYGENNVFKDIYSIPIGVDFRDYIKEEISKIDVLLVLIGSEWLRNGGIKSENDFVRWELSLAKEMDIPIFPVLINSANMPTESDLPKSLSFFSYLHFALVRSGQDFNGDIERIISALNEI